jgi:hypothetical protein
MAVTISSTLCTINATSPISAVIAPHAPLTFVNLGRRRRDDVFRCVWLLRLDQVDIRSPHQ